jgi:hypothetical protein
LGFEKLVVDGGELFLKVAVFLEEPFAVADQAGEIVVTGFAAGTIELLPRLIALAFEAAGEIGWDGSCAIRKALPVF